MSDSARPARGVVDWLWSALREPIVHFLLLGGLLFGVFALLRTVSPGGDGREIVVDRSTLLTFMQFRANAFELDLFTTRLDDLTPGQRQALVDEYVREEVLYREAQAMGLAQGDYIIRNRMVQKLQFLVEDTVEQGLNPTQTELERFYDAYRADYLEPPVYTFTHVFFDAESRGRDEAREAAARMLPELNAKATGFAEASRLGDRPLFFQNYVERTRDFVVDHLGEELAAALDEVEPSETAWYGPFPSRYGWHLVMLTTRVAGRLPALDEILERVREDYRRIALDRERRAAIDQLVREYTVTVKDLDVAP